MNYIIEAADGLAYLLHKGVPYGGSDMYDQVKQVANLLQEKSVSEDKTSIVIAALLHKSREKKRIHADANPLTNEEILVYGPKVLKILNELATEPVLEGASKEEENKAIAAWTEGLSPDAQEILLAEKVINLRTSAERPNMKKPPEWHLNYIKTRMLVIDALRPVNEALYQMCLTYGEQVKDRFGRAEKVASNDVQRPQNGQHTNG